jgi:YidC/Oxa1 family membrane protein insertase
MADNNKPIEARLEAEGETAPTDDEPSGHNDAGGEGAALDALSGRAAPPTQPLDIRRLLMILVIAVGGLVYFFWDDVRDVVSPPDILPAESNYEKTVDAFEPVGSDARLDQNLVSLSVEGDTPGTLGEWVLECTFTKIGGAVTHLTWRKKGQPAEKAEPIVVQDGDLPNRAFLLRLRGSARPVDAEYELTEKRTDADGAHIRVFRCRYGGGGSPLEVVKRFRIRTDVPVIELQISIDNIPDGDWLLDPSLDDDGDPVGGYRLVLANAVGRPSEMDAEDGQITVRADNIATHHAVRRISGTQDWPGEEEEQAAGHGHTKGTPTLQWVSVASKYFGLIVVPKEPKRGAQMRFTRTHECGAAVDVHLPPRDAIAGLIVDEFTIYAGPKHYDVLRTLEGRPQESIDYWYFGRPATLLLQLIHNKVVANYGVAIILVTILFRVLMWPVARYNLRSLVDIKVANARLEEIDAREPPRSEREERAWWLKEARVWEDLQRKATIGVFLPMLILLPVLLVLYYTLNVGYEFYREPFALWIDDISEPDPYFVLPVLMGLAMMGQMRKMSENPAKDKSWLWMSAVFTVLFAFFSAGLVIFWTVDVLGGWFQLWVIKRRKPKGETPVKKCERRIREIRAERAAEAAEEGTKEEETEEVADREEQEETKDEEIENEDADND